ncbi:hypothetical protein L218DRAFT_1059021 [Marasmius fiardii PR-910]|nr:hypothetical protein L218DRAFT_1059021 [Marasmius fiardii PR-910]
MILPACLFMVDIAMSAWHTWSVAESEPDSSLLDSATYQRSLYFFAATLAFNLVCTTLIGFKLWRTRQDLKFVEDFDEYHYYGVNHQHVTKAIAIVLESAAIYSAALVCMIGTALVHYSASFILYNSMPPLVSPVVLSLVSCNKPEYPRKSDLVLGRESETAKVSELFAEGRNW